MADARPPPGPAGSRDVPTSSTRPVLTGGIGSGALTKCYSSLRPRRPLRDCECDNAALKDTVQVPTASSESLSFHTLFHDCGTCHRRPADLLCMGCWTGFCDEHATSHYNATTHRVYITYQMSSYDTIYWCNKCQSHPVLEDFDAVLENLCDTKGTYANAPITDKRHESRETPRLRIVATIMQGWRASQEDSYLFVPQMSGTGYSLGAVFDGHGGLSVSEFCAGNFHEVLAAELDSLPPSALPEQIVRALIESFLATDRQLKDEGERDDIGACGTTAVAVLLTGRQVFCSNAGDSRAVLCRGGLAVDLSEDHTPDKPSERERIIRAGSSIYHDGRLDGILSVSRAIGDFDFKQAGQLKAEEQAVTAHPDVTVHDIQATDEFVVLASDGLWNCMTSQEVVAYIHDALAAGRSETDTISSMLDSCVATDVDIGTGTDNMTVVLMRLLQHPTDPPAAS